MSECIREVSVAINGMMYEKVRFAVEKPLKSELSQKTTEGFMTREDTENGCWRVDISESKCVVWS